jgi:hypothetical protein
MSGESRADAEHCAARSKYATEFEFASHVIDARDRPLTTQPGCSHEAVQDACRGNPKFRGKTLP